MNKKFLNIAVSFAMTISSPYAFSQQQNTSVQQAAGSASATSYLADQTATQESAQTSAPPRVQTAGKKANNVQIIGGVAAAAAATYAGVTAYTCFSGCSAAGPAYAGCVAANRCYWWVAGAVAAGVVGIGMIVSANKSKATEMAVTTNAPTVAPYTGPVENVTQLEKAINSNPDLRNDSIKQLVPTLRKMESAGFKVDLKKGTITSPDGKTFDQNSMQSMANSSSGNKKAMEDFQIVSQKMKQASDKAVASMGTDGSSDISVAGGGGGGAAAGGSEVGSGTIPMPGAGIGINRDPAQVAGMTKNYEGEPIGVSADSLFGMMNRRYQFHARQGSFLSQP